MDINELSDGLADSIEHFAPSLVTVDGRRSYPLSGVVWSEKVIVTSSRAVERDEDIRVTLDSGEQIAAELAGRHPRSDLAVLKVSQSLSAANFVGHEALRVGQLVLRLGRPRGIRASLGVISALESDGKRQRILTDAESFRGYSGGAVISTKGDVIGLSSSSYRRPGAVLPTAVLAQQVPLLLEHGHIKRAYLGIGGQAVRLPQALREVRGQKAGLLLVSVEEGSPAAQAGLTLGDIILEVDGQKLGHPKRLMAALELMHAGQVVKMTMLRGGEVEAREVTLGER